MLTIIKSASWVTFGSFHIQNSWAWRLPSACQAIPSVFQTLLILIATAADPQLGQKLRLALAALANIREFMDPGQYERQVQHTIDQILGISSMEIIR